jgi:hypothetical protein
MCLFLRSTVILGGRTIECWTRDGVRDDFWLDQSPGRNTVQSDMDPVEDRARLVVM